MAHACGCQHGSSSNAVDSAVEPARPEETDPGALHCCGAGLALAEAAASVGTSAGAVLAALNEDRKAPA